MSRFLKTLMAMGKNCSQGGTNSSPTQRTRGHRPTVHAPVHGAPDARLWASREPFGPNRTQEVDHSRKWDTVEVSTSRLPPTFLTEPVWRCRRVLVFHNPPVRCRVYWWEGTAENCGTFAYIAFSGVRAIKKACLCHLHHPLVGTPRFNWNTLPRNMKPLAPPVTTKRTRFRAKAHLPARARGLYPKARQRTRSTSGKENWSPQTPILWMVAKSIWHHLRNPLAIPL